MRDLQSPGEALAQRRDEQAKVIEAAKRVAALDKNSKFHGTASSPGIQFTSDEMTVLRALGNENQFKDFAKDKKGQDISLSTLMALSTRDDQMAATRIELLNKIISTDLDKRFEPLVRDVKDRAREVERQVGFSTPSVKAVDSTMKVANREEFNQCFQPKSNFTKLSQDDQKKLFAQYSKAPIEVGALLTILCDGKHGDLKNKDFLSNVEKAVFSVAKDPKGLEASAIQDLVAANTTVKKSMFSTTVTFDGQGFAKEFMEKALAKDPDLAQYVVKQELIAPASPAATKANAATVSTVGLDAFAASGRSMPAPAASPPSLFTPQTKTFDLDLPTAAKPAKLKPQNSQGDLNSRDVSLSPPPLPPRDGEAVLKSDGAIPPISRRGSFREKALNDAVQRQKPTELGGGKS